MALKVPKRVTLTNLIVVCVALLAPAPAEAVCGNCPGAPLPAFVCDLPAPPPTGTGCGGSLRICQDLVKEGVRFDTIETSPGVFEVRLVARVLSPWNSDPGTLSSARLQLFWNTGPIPTHPTDTLCQSAASDRLETYLRFPGLTCAGAPYDKGVYSLRARVCQGAGGCEKIADFADLAVVITKEDLGCPEPPKYACDNCTACPVPGAGANVGGGPPAGITVEGSGPGAFLAYTAAGAGDPRWPGSAAWSQTLGRHWSHTYARRIVQAPGAAHVFLVESDATFREFTDTDSNGVYEKVSPSDEKRRLTKIAGGWELKTLDGEVSAFDNAGLWLSTIDRAGNARTAAYSGGKLDSVSLPDGRSETFIYDPGSGKLATITEVGVGGAASRTWTYVWSGNDLARIARPDGTAWEFFYTDSAFPGFLTRIERVGSDGTSRRVERAWQYDPQGNVSRTWRGDVSPAGANAVEAWSFIYDAPARPTETMVTDPLGGVSTYFIERDTASRKPRITRIEGDCPTCGVGPNAVFEYGDPLNPLLPTAILDGLGHRTEYEHDPDGQPILKIEAAGTPLARITEWTWDAAFPAFPVRIDMPSTAGGAAQRSTLLSYDSEGNATSRRSQGAEAGSFFDLDTVTTFNTAGQPLVIDPPGYAAADQTGFTYDPARGDLLPLSRTDPLIGVTSFEYDAFNRRTAVVDPNGLRTDTAHDGLDRVISVVERGAIAADDLTTTHSYDVFGDLARTTLPRGNLIDYTYDSAGRLLSIERKPDAATAGERTLYTLDTAGNRIKEELQRWDGAAWVTESFTDFLYLNRCQVHKAVHADGKVTEYSYDCDGRLQEVWDENHPREGEPPSGGGGDDCDEPPCEPLPGGGPNPPTQVYGYDALDRLISISQPWAGGGNAVTAYGYDVQGHLTSVIDAEGNTTTYDYSDRDLMTAQVSPVSGTTAYEHNEHGELIEETDARGITAIRTVDALDRVILVDSPDGTLDTAFTYDDPGVPFSKGRLTAITRTGSTVAYAYDRFGRMIQDGELTYGYDKNGNRIEIGYPGNVTARRAHDFADREAALEIQVEAAAPQPLVTAANYKPFGPLASLTLGNGLSEARSFNARYFPSRIEVPGRLDQVYTTDAVGNIATIHRTVGTEQFPMAFAYQDPQYFLTQGTGPWGPQEWTYDRIGNRLSEGAGDADERYTYTYVPNGGGGNTPELSQIAPAPGGDPGSSLIHGFDAAGNQTTVTASSEETAGRTSFLDYSAEGRLSQLHTSDGTGTTELLYDGRGFLRRSRLTFSGSSDFEQTEPVYSSEGQLLVHRHHKQDTHGGRGDAGEPPTDRVAMETTYLFYFAGRPLAQLKRPQAGGGVDELLFLTADHLGTPILATDSAGTTVWEGGLSPFGTPFVFPTSQPPGEEEDPPLPEGGDQDAATGSAQLASAAATMESAGLFLRFPGQWVDPSFRSHGVRGGLYYNVHRWYGPSSGSYSQPDPLHFVAPIAAYRYALSNPVRFVDGLGLQALPASPLPPAAPPSIRLVPPLPPVCKPSPWTAAGRGLAATSAAFMVVLNELFNPVSAGERGISDYYDPACKPKCGDCDPREHAFLQDAVNRACKTVRRRCVPGMSPQQLEVNFFWNAECYYARQEINNRCYRRFRDEGHSTQIEEAAQAVKTCADLMTRPGGGAR